MDDPEVIGKGDLWLALLLTVTFFFLLRTL